MEGQDPVQEQFQAKVTSWAARDVAIRSSRLRLACMPAPPPAMRSSGCVGRWPRPTLPRVTFTWPEIAAFGVRPDRAADRRGRLVGAMIVGPRAGESLAELVLATRHLRARGLGAAMQAYPTDSDGVWKAAIAEVQHELNRPAVAAGPGC